MEIEDVAGVILLGIGALIVSDGVRVLEPYLGIIGTGILSVVIGIIVILFGGWVLFFRKR